MSSANRDSKLIFEAYSDHANMKFPQGSSYTHEFISALIAILTRQGYTVEESKVTGNHVATKHDDRFNGEDVGADAEFYFDENGHFHIDATSWVDGKDYKEDKGPIKSEDLRGEGMDATLAATWITDAIREISVPDDDITRVQQHIDSARDEEALGGYDEFSR